MQPKPAGILGESEERSSALHSNAAAIRAVTAAVERTLGPKGLDTMLVDRYGDVLVTNAGVTILEKMEVSHPAAIMLIKVAQAQQEAVGDGTTTATLLANALIQAGVEQIDAGVPVAQVILGIKSAVQQALILLAEHSLTVSLEDTDTLEQIALVAGREHRDIAKLVVEAATLVGNSKLSADNWRLADTIIAKAGMDNAVFLGVTVEKERLSSDLPSLMTSPKLLFFEDALEPEEVRAEAQGTESGYAHYLELQKEFLSSLAKLIDSGVEVIFCERGISPIAEEVLGEAGIIAIPRIPAKSLRQGAEHCATKPIKRGFLKRSVLDITKVQGTAKQIAFCTELGQIRISGGAGVTSATLLVGAATVELVAERERIAGDAASSLQAALRGGIVPGGGATELALASELSKLRGKQKGMSVYGWDCVISALKRPIAQIVQNAGFNPLEKVEMAHAAQSTSQSNVWGIDCDSGEVCDMLKAGIVDPTEVKSHALRTAAEITEAILQIGRASCRERV